eukprot:gnl/Hemi2/20719_TR6860_c0_g5_i1.p1 gnl/Hemi2/20719_TR6860_c0_g5~~gnl/Hemi2/20719_TR6860_c0_g5_i1.p1  ORF type:complete len:585 (-),score=227.86 gnl/Hemi2/20719_TR6860_c0_g5_i1:79-1833(-)
MELKNSSYYDQYLRAKQKPNAADTTRLLTDRSAYISYLEVQLERVTASCMTVQSFSERIEQVQGQLNTSEEKVMNLTKLVKMTQAYAEQQEDENGKLRHQLTDINTRLNSIISEVDAKIQNKVHDISDQVVREKLHFHTRSLQSEIQEIEERLNRERSERLQDEQTRRDTASASEKKLTLLVDESLSVYKNLEQRLEKTRQQAMETHTNLQMINKRLDSRDKEIVKSIDQDLKEKLQFHARTVHQELQNMEDKIARDRQERTQVEADRRDHLSQAEKRTLLLVDDCSSSHKDLEQRLDKIRQHISDTQVNLQILNQKLDTKDKELLELVDAEVREKLQFTTHSIQTQIQSIEDRLNRDRTERIQDDLGRRDVIGHSEKKLFNIVDEVITANKSLEQRLDKTRKELVEVQLNVQNLGCKLEHKDKEVEILGEMITSQPISRRPALPALPPASIIRPSAHALALESEAAALRSSLLRPSAAAASTLAAASSTLGSGLRAPDPLESSINELECLVSSLEKHSVADSLRKSCTRCRTPSGRTSKRCTCPGKRRGGSGGRRTAASSAIEDAVESKKKELENLYKELGAF